MSLDYGAGKRPGEGHRFQTLLFGLIAVTVLSWCFMGQGMMGGGGSVSVSDRC